MNYRNVVLLLMILGMTGGCNNDNDRGNQGLIIRGNLSNTTKGAQSKAFDVTALTDASQVLVFNSSGGYDLFPIENNTFTANAMPGTATALVFLGGNNSFIGCLHSGGLNVLPLVSLSDGENTIIDLNDLTLDGTRVIPGNNPIGNEIMLAPDEIERYHQLGAFYESLSYNIDTDHDSIPDLIDNKALFVSTMFDIYCGSWGLNDTPAENIDISRFYVNYSVRISGGSSIMPENTNIVLSGPDAAPYNDIVQYHYSPAPDGFISFFRRETVAPPGHPFGSAFLPFENGIYSLVLDDKAYTLRYSNIDVSYFFILAVLTVHTNEQDEIDSITVEYRDVNGLPVDAQNFVYQTMVMLNGPNASQLCQIGVLWESPEAKSNDELYTYVPSETINISELSGLAVNYIDLVGNAYLFVYNN
jgi:hypothetical protein